MRESFRDRRGELGRRLEDMDGAAESGVNIARPLAFVATDVNHQITGREHIVEAVR